MTIPGNRNLPEDGPHIDELPHGLATYSGANLFGYTERGYTTRNPAHVALFRYETIGGRRPTQVAESMQIKKQSINDLIRDLERHGYAQYQPARSDRLARLIRLAARKYAIAAELTSRTTGSVREHPASL